MRHVFMRGAITPSPGGMVETTGAGGLVTAGGGAETLPAGAPRAIGRAIALTPVTAAAQQDLTAAACAQEESGRGFQQALSDGECG